MSGPNSSASLTGAGQRMPLEGSYPTAGVEARPFLSLSLGRAHLIFFVDLSILLIDPLL